MQAHSKLLCIRIFGATLLSLFLSSTFFAQELYLTNKTWEILSGNPASGLEWSASARGSNGDIYTTGNFVDANFNVSLTLYKQSPSGQIVWDVLYNGIPNAKSYGIALTVDNNDNVYVAGAYFNPTTQNHDYLILKYNSFGVQLWSHLYADTGNGDDFPAAIAIDDSNNVYVTGVTFDQTTDYDYLTIKVNSNGSSTAWNKKYDYAALKDAAVAINIKGSGSSALVIVTGGSASSTTDWDYANLTYNSSNGNQVNELRTGASNSGLEMPTALTTDDANNYYVTGYGGTAGQPTNIYTVKLDEDFNLIWEKWYDGESLEDKAYDVEVDDNGNVYI